MGATESRTLLDRIGSERAESAKRAVIELFDQFDRDRSGRIEGYEIGTLVESITIYIFNLIHSETPSRKLNRSAIRSWVLSSIDTNRNGVLTRDELLSNLPRMMGEVKSGGGPLRSVSKV